MRSFLIILFFALASTIFSQQLDEFGHIKNVNQAKEYKIEFQGNHQTIIYLGNTYPGNTLIPLKSGFATIENSCGNTPPTIRIYDKNRVLKINLTYSQTINPRTDPTRQFLYFQNNKNTVVLNTETLEEQVISSTAILEIRDGKITHYNSEEKTLYTPKYQHNITFTPHSLEISKDGVIYLFGRHHFAIIDQKHLSIKQYKTGNYFDSETIEGNVFWVEKRNKSGTFLFTLNQLLDNKVTAVDKHSVIMTTLSKEVNYKRSDGEQILCPMFPDSIDYPFRIGNSYAEHQHYGGAPYLHPGVDILGVPQQEIYSPVGGIVKAIITTSGFIYWRLALGLEDTDDTQDGYLFAHLDPATIPFAVGDSVQAGDYIGSIVEWPTSEFHHLHFARIMHQGEIWDGNWLTKDNVLSDITNFKDESPPVFEPLWNGQTITFRSQDGSEVLSPDHLYGTFDIICHAHDLSNDTWRLDVDSLWFELINLTTNTVVHQQEAFSYNFVLDTYFNNQNTTKILNTIYSTEGEWLTLGNYGTRKFYQKVSRSNGDGVIDDLDESVYFDSTLFPDDSYLLRIHAYDAAKNHSSTELEVIINNMPTSLNEEDSNLPTIYPNPNTGKFTLNPNGSTISKGIIYNYLGQLVSEFQVKSDTEKDILIQKSGIYFIHFFNNENQVISKQKVMVQD